MIRRTSFSLAAAALAVAGGLAFAQPAQADFRVNTTVAGTQINSDTAVNPTDGSFVVVWQSDTGNGYDIYLQRYDVSGNPLGGQVLVNNDNTAGRQSRPSVAVDATGDIVVVWESDNGDGSSYGIFGQRYTSTGAEVGDNFQVNTTTTGLQTAPDVAMDDAGNFIVVYEDASLGENNYNLRARSFTAAGVGGTEQLINSETGNQQLPDVSINDAGTQAVVVYQDSAQDGSGYGIAGLLLTTNFAGGTVAAGSGEFTVNQTFPGDQSEPAVDMDADGDFVVGWHSGAAGSRDVYARRYSSTATPLSNEFIVGSTSGDQYLADVAVADSASGPFVVVYGSDQTESYEIYAQRYDATGVAQGGPVVVNDVTTGSQVNPSVDADNSGNFVIAWDGNQTGDYDIYADRFTPAGATVPQGTPFVQTDGNECPTASFFTTQSPSTQPGQTRVTINASGSSDPDGDTLQYTYEVRDQNNNLVRSNTTSNSTQQFDLPPGSYTVRVIVSDGSNSCDTTEGPDVVNQPLIIEQPGSTFNSSVNASGYVVPNDGGKKVQLSFFGSFNQYGLSGGLTLKDPRTGYSFKSTQITSIIVNGKTATITGFGTSNGPDGTNEDVAFTATGIDIYPVFLNKGDQVQVETDDGYFLQGVYNTGDVKVAGGNNQQPPVDQTRTR